MNTKRREFFRPTFNPVGTAAAQCRENMTVSTVTRGYLGIPKTTLRAELARVNTVIEREDIAGTVKDELLTYQTYLQSIVTERRWLDEDDED